MTGDQLDETKLLEQRTRGQQAKDIIDNPLFKQAFQELEKEAFEQFAMSEESDKEARDNAYWLLQAASKFQQWFIMHIANGSAASTLLTQMKEEKAKDEAASG